LRDELRFASADELSAQIARDVAATRAALRDRADT
jgi:FAD synthase